MTQEQKLDRAFDVLEKFRDAGLVATAGSSLEESQLLSGGGAGVGLRSASASLAASLTALSRRVASLAGLPAGVAWDGEAVGAAAGKVLSVCSDEGACGGGGLETALADLLHVLDPALPLPAEREELLGACASKQRL